jgi:hypothetical protein
MRRIPFAVGLALACCAAEVRAQGWADFPPYPGSVELCDQLVYGNVATLHWTAYTSRDAPAAVIAFYEGRLGQPQIDRDERTFKVESDGVVQRALSVHPVSGTYPRCGKDPEPGARALVIVSRRLPR